MIRVRRTTSMRHDEPRCSNKSTAAVCVRVDCGSAFDCRPVHVPDLRLISYGVVPQDIVDAVPVEIIGTDNAPRQPNERRPAIVLPIHRRSSGYLFGIHIPDLRLATRGVMPDDILLAVIVHVAGRDDAPRQTDENGGAILG